MTGSADDYVSLAPGDPAPTFILRSPSQPRYVFDTAAGRYIVLFFFGSASEPAARAALDEIAARRQLFDDAKVSFFGVSLDQHDESERRIADSPPGLRFFYDFEGQVSRRYGALPRTIKPGAQQVALRRFWVVLDPTLRVIRVIRLAPDGSDRTELFALLEDLPPVDLFAGLALQAPILFLANVFEPEFCRQLIDLYERHGGTESGVMRETDGKTVLVSDHAVKRRKDYLIQDPAVMEAAREKVRRRIAPEIHKAHQFRVTRMEQYIVACYAAEDGAHFARHRDSNTKATAHRRFAVSINLNADFEGGEIGFPEYGSRTFKPPAGGAVVFSCSLLNAVSPVTSGRRYAFLPFLYDEEAARIREANNPHLAAGTKDYRVN